MRGCSSGAGTEVSPITSFKKQFIRRYEFTKLDGRVRRFHECEHNSDEKLPKRVASILSRMIAFDYDPRVFFNLVFRSTFHLAEHVVPFKEFHNVDHFRSHNKGKWLSFQEEWIERPTYKRVPNAPPIRLFKRNRKNKKHFVNAILILRWCGGDVARERVDPPRTYQIDAHLFCGAIIQRHHDFNILYGYGRQCAREVNVAGIPDGWTVVIFDTFPRLKR